MNLPLERAVAKPCAWIWTCPICTLRITVIRTPAGFEMQEPLCLHVMSPEQTGGVLELTYTRSEP